MLHIYTFEEKDFLKEYVPGHSYKEIQQAFNDKFGWGASLNQIKGCIARYKLNTGRTGYFEKGQIPHNKGKKMPLEVYEKAKGTMFQKGQTPVNHRPVGSERIDSENGYILIKVAEPNKWRHKHVYVWEQHNGKVPSQHVIILLDGNKLNTDISNLKCISRSELLIMNKRGLFSENAELTEVGANVAAVVNAVNERKKSENHGE